MIPSCFPAPCASRGTLAPSQWYKSTQKVGLGEEYGGHKANQWHLQWEGSLLFVQRLQDDYSRILCLCGGNTEYGQPVLPLPLTVNWVMCFRTKLRKEFQTYYQINPFIADNCLSYKHLPWACSGRKVHNKPPWILPFAVVTEGIFLSAGDMASWGQKLSVAEEKGWRLEEILPDEAILWSFCSYLSSSKRMKELKLLPKVIFINF